MSRTAPISSPARVVMAARRTRARNRGSATQHRSSGRTLPRSDPRCRIPCQVPLSWMRQDLAGPLTPHRDGSTRCGVKYGADQSALEVLFLISLAGCRCDLDVHNVEPKGVGCLDEHMTDYDWQIARPRNVAWSSKRIGTLALMSTGCVFPRTRLPRIRC